jgi:hypothetical protein
VSCALAGEPASTSTCAGTGLTLHIINAAGVSPGLVSAATAETSAIWERTGVRLTWIFSPPPSPRADRTLLVILGRGPQLPKASGERGKNRLTDSLGWVDFSADDRPGDVIHVWFDTIAALARRGTALNLRVGDLPDDAQEPLLARAIGRVLAHELGHWIGGRRHTAGGLMSATFRERELLDWWSPRLPREWTTAAFVTPFRVSPECASAVALASSSPALAPAPR